MSLIELRLDMPLISKARPRCGKGHAYLPSAYREWKKLTQMRLEDLWIQNQLPTFSKAIPIKNLTVEAHGPGRSDSDNLLGALLDAGLPQKPGWRGCWTDDRVTIIPSVCFYWIRSREQFWVIRILTDTTP